ncbi:MAG: tetratricopeptide repeat protein [Desulfovibrio sp.]|nr:tetratricopeptide repeat protein [Desulfovibrio sp.]
MNSGYADEAIVELEQLLNNGKLEEAEQAVARDMLGKAFIALGQISKGLCFFREEAGILRKRSEKDAAAFLLFIDGLHNYAQALSLAGSYEEAREMLDESLAAITLRLGKSSNQYGKALFYMAEVAYRQRQFDKAEEYLLEALEIWAGGSGPKEMYGTALNNLGRICEEKGDMKAGMEWHRKAVQYRRNLPNRANLAFSLGNYGLALAMGDELRQAVKSLRECLEIYSDMNMEECKDAQAFNRNLQILEQAMRGNE